MSVMLNNQRAGISKRLERLPSSPYLMRIGGLVLVASFLEAIDMSGIGYLLPVLGQFWHLGPKALGYLASITYVGMFFGSIVCGYLADKFGRKPVLIAAMLIWGVFGIVFAFSWSVSALFITRLIFGIGLGAQIPVGTSLLSELVPSRLRGKYIVFFMTVLPIGMAVGGLLTYLFLPYLGWRGMFVLEAFFALWAFVIWKHLPESALWLESKARYNEADAVMEHIEQKIEKNTGQPLPVVEATYADTPAPEAVKEQSPFAELFSRHHMKITIMATIWMFTTMMAFYGINLWLTSLLVAKGFAIIKSMGYVALIALGGVPGYFFISYMIEKVGRKWMVVLMAVLTAVMAYSYGQAPTLGLVIGTGLLYMFCQYSFNMVNQVYLPELFSTRLRGTGVGYTAACGRLGATIGPIIIGYILAGYGPTAVMLFAFGVNLVTAVVVALLGPETKGKVF
ncbi:MAG: MFS transporter [Firmicutes bacterium]|nr:MFS transporter [Bacillota bacterium]